MCADLHYFVCTCASMCVSVCKLVHFATMSETQAPLQEMKMSVKFPNGRRVNLMYPSLFTCLLLQISFYMSATQAPLEEIKTSVR